MNKNEILKLAIDIANTAHAGAVDKAGAPYIAHVMRVADNVKGFNAKIAAYLHDVIEDSGYTSADLIDKGIPRVIVEAVDLLTKPKDMSYTNYIIRLGVNPIARAVKIADLLDNMDLSRLESIGPGDVDRLNKYIGAYHYLAALL